MVEAMSKPRSDGTPKDSPARPTKKNLNVGLEDGEQIAKVAAHRGLTIEELFAAPDVREFFTHLLIAEMRKEERKLRGRIER